MYALPLVEITNSVDTGKYCYFQTWLFRKKSTRFSSFVVKALMNIIERVGKIQAVRRNQLSVQKFD